MVFSTAPSSQQDQGQSCRASGPAAQARLTSTSPPLNAAAIFVLGNGTGHSKNASHTLGRCLRASADISFNHAQPVDAMRAACGSAHRRGRAHRMHDRRNGPCYTCSIEDGEHVVRDGRAGKLLRGPRALAVAALTE